MWSSKKKTFDLCGEHRFAVADSFIHICGNYHNPTPLEKLQLVVDENGSTAIAGLQKKGKKSKKHTQTAPAANKNKKPVTEQEAENLNEEEADENEREDNGEEDED